MSGAQSSRGPGGRVIVRYLSGAGEATASPRRSPGRGPPYWKGGLFSRICGWSPARVGAQGCDRGDFDGAARAESAGSFEPQPTRAGEEGLETAGVKLLGFFRPYRAAFLATTRR